MKTRKGFLYWAPRILCIIAILFLSLFALDSFGTGKSVLQQLGDFFMHMLPMFLLIVLLILAWKKELIGGIIFIAVGLCFTPWIYKHNYGMNHSIWLSLSAVLMVTFPFILVGILFVLSYFKQKRNNVKNE